MLIGLRIRNRGDIISYEPRRPVPWQGVDLAVLLLAFFLVSAIVIGAWRSLDKDFLKQDAAHSTDQSPKITRPNDKTEKPGTGDEVVFDARVMAADALMELIMVGVAIGWVTFRVRATRADVGFTLSRFGSDVVIGAMAFFASAIPVLLLEHVLESLVPYKHKIVEAVKQQPDGFTFAIATVSAVCIAPLFEELFFRVLIQGCLEAVEAKRKWILQRHIAARAAAANPPAAQRQAELPPAREGAENPYRSPAAPVLAVATEEELRATSGPAAWPIVASSALFAVIHWGQGAAPVPLFFFALVLGYVYQRTHRIWPSMVTHAMLNGTSMLMLWFSVKPA
jgi:membrane protease YdiL (CAAX protease family)